MVQALYLSSASLCHSLVLHTITCLPAGRFSLDQRHLVALLYRKYKYVESDDNFLFFAAGWQLKPAILKKYLQGCNIAGKALSLTYKTPNSWN